MHERTANPASRLVPARCLNAAMTRKRCLWLAAVLLLLVSAFFVRGHFYRLEQERLRIQWKDAALLRLAALEADPAAIAKELESIKDRGALEWTGDRLLMMTNGEYLVFESRHGFNSGYINHLFLARGSNGKWLYSTYHFCNSMVAILGDDPPGSIAEFSKRYSAREFDGKSDVCLEKTWPE